jgi:ADP-heptose:LPS heptosyltransferase
MLKAAVECNPSRRGPDEDFELPARGAADFRDTAKIIEGLSQVVTVDTALTHLAALRPG